MNEIGTVELNQKYSSSACRLNKRLCDFEETSSSKHIKHFTNAINEQVDINSLSDIDLESTCSSCDIEESKIESCDDNSDIEDFEDESNISTDQSQLHPVVIDQRINQQRQFFSKRSRQLIKQFHYIYDHSKRKRIETTPSINNDDGNQRKSLRWEFRNTFDRVDLFKEGYAVLSDETFPFHSLCYMCGSMGMNLVYCNNCCEAYHRSCLTESECPRLCPTPESWLCPRCTVCDICGLEKDSSLISCSDCRRTFHTKCIKPSKDEHQCNGIRSQQWFCPSCIKCDCGQALTSNEQNLLSLTKSFSSQQSLMCSDCLNNMKIIRTNRTSQIEKCHLCERFVEQFITKPKPLFSLTLIGKQLQQNVNYLLQCIKCKHRFHPKCDGYLNEDVSLMPYIKSISANIICSKCDQEQRKNIQKYLLNYKVQVVKSTIANIISTLQIMISEETRLNNMKHYMSNLQQLHLSRSPSLNLHAFINDLLVIIQRLLENIDSRQWQAAINNCIHIQCPWFKSSSLYSNAKTLLFSATNTSTMNHNSNIYAHRSLPPPSIDHTYSLSNDRILFQSNLYKNNLLTSSDSLLRYIDNKLDREHSFENLHQIDTRLCQLCQTYADHVSSNISRLISTGVNQWVHIGCILPAYVKHLDQPPYILRNIHDTLNRCLTKYKCDICSKLGASVQCYENDCNVRFHCQCIDDYYSKVDRSLQEKLNMINGLLPNLTTLCMKHGRKKFKSNDSPTNEDSAEGDTDLPKLKSVNLSSTVYADLSNSCIEFSLSDIKLCIGSLQIQSLGNFDYLLDDDPNMNIYPNQYVASRLFWSTKNPRQKTIYRLHIDIEQTYHNDQRNHRTTDYPLSKEEINREQLYETCRKYFLKYEGNVEDVSKHSKIENPKTNGLERLLSTSSKCQTTPTSLLKHVIRPRTRLNNENNFQFDKSSSTTSDSNVHTMCIDGKILRHLFNNDSSDHSRFALTLMQALQNVDPTLSLSKIQQHEPIFSYYVANQADVPSNDESIMKKTKNLLFEQLSKNTDLIQTVDDSSTEHQLQSTSVNIVQSGFTETTIPQIDGSIDANDENTHSTNEDALHDRSCSTKKSISSDELVYSYQQWSTSKFGRAKFTIISDDGCQVVSDNLDEAWLAIVKSVRECRDDMNLTHLPMSNQELNGHEVFGLTKAIVKTMFSQIYTSSLLKEKQTDKIILPQSSTTKTNSMCFLKKKMVYNRKNLLINSRLNVYQRKQSQRQRFGWLLNPNRRIDQVLKSFEIDNALLYARQILLEEPSVGLRLYHLKYFSQRALIVASSSIHGCGLFTLIDLVEGQMIIEYTGEVIRSCLTDKRERENEKKGVGCYMFTVDSINVIDATHEGNKARFINHNCQPNCFAKTVLSGGVKHIVIYALTNINRGSELTYDYSFPNEDIKIPCYCGASQCRIYLN